MSTVSGEPRDLLKEHAAARDESLKTTARLLSGEDACRAGLVIGSIGRGTQDEWSDLDLLLFVESSSLIDDLPEWTTRFGRVLRVGQAPPRNAPVGGRQVSVWYDIGTVMPLVVDWNVWPLRFAAQPHNTRLWFNRAGQPLPDPGRGFDAYASSLPRVDDAAWQPSSEEVRRFHFSMVPIAAKYIARRDTDRTKLAFSLVGLPMSLDDPRGQLAELGGLSEKVSVGESQDAITAVRTMLRVVADLS
jgi:hypothetical protein